MEIIPLSVWKQTSFRARLRDFYQRLDSITLSIECGSQARSDFFRKNRGEFLTILRMKKGLSGNQLAPFLKISPETMSRIEQGQTEIDDLAFFNLCIYLGSANELPIFVEKMENAMRPGLRDARNSAQKILKLYGICFNEDSHGR